MVPATLLNGKRIFVLEEDDALYSRLRDCVKRCGGFMFGSLPPLPDLPVCIPSSRIDAALIDVDAADVSLPGVIRELLARGVPLLLTSGTAPLPDSTLARYRPLLKPYEPEAALERVAALLQREPTPH